VPYVDPVTGLFLSAWWKRLLAWLVDYALITGFFLVLEGIVVGLVAATTPALNTANRGPSAGGWVAIGLFGALALLAPAVYFGVSEGTLRGQSVGKLALGIGVRDATSAQLIGFWRAFGRYWFNVLLALPFDILFLVGNLAPLWDARRRSWADHVVSSVVVDLRP